MAEFHFYSTCDDWQPILDAVLREHGVRFAPDRWFPTKECYYYDRLDDAALDEVRVKRRVFLVGDYSDGPLFLRRQLTGPRAGQYSIDPGRGGPCIDLTLPACSLERGTWRLSDGVLYRRSAYLTDDPIRAETASARLKAAYEGMVRTIRARTVRSAMAGNVWLSPAALELIRAGKAVVRVDGRWHGGSRPKSKRPPGPGG